MDRFDQFAREVLYRLADEGFIRQANQRQILEAIRNSTPYWRKDRAKDFFEAMAIRGWIRHRGFQVYDLKQIGQRPSVPEEKPAEAKAKARKPKARKPKPKRRRR